MLTLRGRAAPPGGIIPAVHNILAVPPTNQEGFKGTSSLRDGVSTYLALTFGTLLSSQGTEASIEAHHRPLRAFPSLFLQLIRPSRVRFPLAHPSSRRFRDREIQPRRESKVMIARDRRGLGATDRRTVRRPVPAARTTLGARRAGVKPPARRI